MVFKLAWRNLWRNKRRTVITISAVAFAVLWSAVLQSIQTGTWDKMIDNMSRFYMGYAQVHSKGYWGEQSLDLGFEPNEVISAVEGKLPENVDMVPRLESFALASYGLQTQGVLIMGIDLEEENKLTGIGNKITEGAFLKAATSSVIIGDKLAEKLNMAVGDTLVLLSQGYHGQNAVGKYPVAGLVHLNSPDLNKRLVALSLTDAQNFFGMPDLITTYAINLPSKKYLPQTIDVLRSQLDTTVYEVMDYNDLIPELLEAAKLDQASGSLIHFILFLLIGFGLLGTIIMMTKERSYEFGVLTAIGTERSKLAGILWIESVLLGVVGALTGIALCLPIIYYLHSSPIQLTGNMADQYERFGMEAVISTAFNPGIFINQAIIMFVMSTVLSLYPVIKSLTLKPIEAMKS